MNYRDEEIIRQQKAMQAQQQKDEQKEMMEKEKEESIYQGSIHLFGKEVEFQRRTIEEYDLSLLMPVDFEELDKESKDVLYPYGKAPKYAFASGDVPFQITLNLTENVVPDEGIPKFMVMAKKVMERIGPQARILSNVVIKKEARNMGLMEIATNGIDMSVYNTQFYLSLKENQLLIGAVTCPAKNHDRMVPVIKEIIDSVIIKEEKDNGDDYLSESKGRGDANQ